MTAAGLCHIALCVVTFREELDGCNLFYYICKSEAEISTIGRTFFNRYTLLITVDSYSAFRGLQMPVFIKCLQSGGLSLHNEYLIAIKKRLLSDETKAATDFTLSEAIQTFGLK